MFRKNLIKWTLSFLLVSHGYATDNVKNNVKNNLKDNLKDSVKDLTDNVKKLLSSYGKKYGLIDNQKQFNQRIKSLGLTLEVEKYAEEIVLLTEIVIKMKEIKKMPQTVENFIDFPLINEFNGVFRSILKPLTIGLSIGEKSAEIAIDKLDISEASQIDLRGLISAYFNDVLPYEKKISIFLNEKKKGDLFDFSKNKLFDFYALKNTVMTLLDKLHITKKDEQNNEFRIWRQNLELGYKDVEYFGRQIIIRSIEQKIARVLQEKRIAENIQDMAKSFNSDFQAKIIDNTLFSYLESFLRADDEKSSEPKIQEKIERFLKQVTTDQGLKLKIDHMVRNTLPEEVLGIFRNLVEYETFRIMVSEVIDPKNISVKSLSTTKISPRRMNKLARKFKVQSEENQKAVDELIRQVNLLTQLQEQNRQEKSLVKDKYRIDDLENRLQAVENKVGLAK